MPKITIDVNKLENGTTEFISLVKRSNTRMPFKILKSHPQSENDMIDLGTRKLDLSDIRNVIKGEGDPNDQTLAPTRGSVVVPKADAPQPVEPKLVGFVVEKGDYLTPEVIASLKAAGINTDTPIENEDGTILYKQDDEDADVIVKLGEHALALVSNLDPEVVIKGTPYEKVYDEIGFLPSPKEAINSMVIKSEGGLGELAAMSIAANTYIQRLNDMLPTLALKANDIVNKAMMDMPPKNIAGGKGSGTMNTGLTGQDMAGGPVGDATADCPFCHGKGCAACGDTGKVMKADAPRMELLLKAFPPKKPAAAPVAAPAVPATTAPPTKPASPNASASNGVDAEDRTDGGADESTEAPEGVDAEAWAKMTPEEQGTVRAAAQGSSAPVATAVPGTAPAPAAAAAAPPTAAPAPAGADPATLPSMTPVMPMKKPNPFAKKASDSQEVAAAATIPAMDATVQKMLTDISASLEKIVKSQDDLAARVDAQGKEIAAVKGTALKTEKVVNSAVIGGVPADDRAPATVKKNESQLLGVIDTAFDRSVRVTKSYAERAEAAQRRTPARR